MPTLNTPIPESERVLAHDWLEIVTRTAIPDDEQPYPVTCSQLIKLLARYGMFAVGYRPRKTRKPKAIKPKAKASAPLTMAQAA